VYILANSNVTSLFAVSVVTILTLYLVNDSNGLTCANYDKTKRLITITCDSTLSDLDRTISDGSILKKESPDGIWFLNSSLLISKGATLTVNSTDTKWLKISSEGRSFGVRLWANESQENLNERIPYFIQILGSINLHAVRVTSWDPLTNTYANQNSDGTIPRPFIYIQEAADPSIISSSEISYLGYKSPRKQGLNFYGGDNSILKNNKIHNMFFGFFSSGIGNLTLENNHVYANTRYGLDPHTGTHDMLIKNNRVYDNGHIGIICSLDCTKITIEGNTVFNNTNAGVMVSKNVQDSVVRNNTIYDENTGVSVSESSSDKVHHNTISHSRNGIQVKLNSSDNQVHDNIISKSERCGIEISGSSSNNTITANAILNSSTYGVCLVNGPSDNTFSNNTISAASGTAVQARNSQQSSNVFKYNDLVDVSHDPVKLTNSTLTFINNTLK
jgi:mannuronan 5-epimerase